MTNDELNNQELKDEEPEKSGKTGWWNKQGKWTKIGSIVGLCCLGLVFIALIAAMGAPDQTTSDTSPSTTPSTTSDTSPSTDKSSSSSESSEKDYNVYGNECPVCRLEGISQVGEYESDASDGYGSSAYSCDYTHPLIIYVPSDSVYSYYADYIDDYNIDEDELMSYSYRVV